MALTYGLTYTFQDDSGDTATATIHLPTTFSLAQFTEFGRAMAAFVDDIVSGVVISAELTVGVDISTLANNTTDFLSDVEEVSSYQFVTAANRPVLVNIPGTDENDVQLNSDDLDQVAVGQAAFINAMVNGIAVTGGTIAPTDVDSEDITAIVYAREAFRASGKRR